jgi:hypothetical protein
MLVESYPERPAAELHPLEAYEGRSKQSKIDNLLGGFFRRTAVPASPCCRTASTRKSVEQHRARVREAKARGRRSTTILSNLSMRPINTLSQHPRLGRMSRAERPAAKVSIDWRTAQ